MRALVHEKVRASFLLRGCHRVHLRKVLVGPFGVLLRCMRLLCFDLRAYRGRSRRIMVEAVAAAHLQVAPAVVTPLLCVSARVTADLVTSENHRLLVWNLPTRLHGRRYPLRIFFLLAFLLAATRPLCELLVAPDRTEVQACLL